MHLLADLHTHTVASGHAYSTVTELALAARTRGLELIAMTDHGPSVPGGAHDWYFWALNAVPSVLDGVRILKGVEANPQPGTPNGVDLPDDLLAQLDFVAVGFHPLSGFDEGDSESNTDAMLRVLRNPLVDMITHPGNGAFPIDVAAVVAAAVENRVVLEINAHSFDARSSRHHLAEQERRVAVAAREAGALVAVSSDAHYHMRVGDFEAGLALASELGYTEEDMVNRDAASVLAFLESKRPRPRLESGGRWEGGVRL